MKHTRKRSLRCLPNHRLIDFEKFTAEHSNVAAIVNLTLPKPLSEKAIEAKSKLEKSFNAYLKYQSLKAEADCAALDALGKIEKLRYLEFNGSKDSLEFFKVVSTISQKCIFLESLVISFQSMIKYCRN